MLSASLLGWQCNHVDVYNDHHFSRSDWSALTQALDLSAVLYFFIFTGKYCTFHCIHLVALQIGMQHIFDWIYLIGKSNPIVSLPIEYTLNIHVNKCIWYVSINDIRYLKTYSQGLLLLLQLHHNIKKKKSGICLTSKTFPVAEPTAPVVFFLPLFSSGIILGTLIRTSSECNGSVV